MNERTATLNRVLLSFPTLVNLATTKADADTPALSWIQLAVVGDFVSSRYGKFSITKDDLAQMVRNFAADRTPIDYDHLTNGPQKPFDGIAAGWLQRVELRDAGTTLWGLAAWTPRAAEAIENKEYQFISPSFMKDYRTATGESVGTKLLAAALTNMPFLPNLAAVTLGADAVFGQFALSLPAETKAAPINLAEVGQRLTFIENEEATPELSPQERAQVFVVAAIGGGTGDNAFVKLETAESRKPYGWYPLKVLAPAPAPERTTEENTNMQTEANLAQQAAQFFARVEQHYKNTGDWTKAFSLAQHEDEPGAVAYRLTGVGAAVATTPEPAPVLSLSERPGESFDDLVSRYANEKGVPLRVAAHEVGRAHPDLAAARG